MTDDDRFNSRTTEFEAIFFALDESSQSFLLETGRALVRRTEQNAASRRPKLSLVPPRLLQGAEDGINSTIELVAPPIVSEPEGS